MSPGRAGLAEAHPGAVTELQSVVWQPSVHSPRPEQGLGAAAWALLPGQVLAPSVSGCGSTPGEEGAWWAAAAGASTPGTLEQAAESLGCGGTQMTFPTLDSILPSLGLETTGPQETS